MKPIKLIQLSTIIVALIFLLLPFHAVFTTWLGSNFNHLDLFRIWKELLFIPLGLLSLLLLAKDKAALSWLTKSRLLYLIIGYTTLYLILGLVGVSRHHVNANALIYAWLAALRFIVFFTICFIVARKSNRLKVHWRQLIIAPALIVIIFGLLQHFVLPTNFLRHFGYGPNTIPVYETVDQKSQYVRIQSTLKGPNPLGAYLSVIIVVLIAALIKDKPRRVWWLLIIAAAILVMFYSYSRSAWLGAILAVGLFCWWQIKNEMFKKSAVIILGLVVAVGVSALLLLRHNSVFENVVFHTDEHSRSSQSSNQSRTEAIKSGVKDVIHEPWGRGPGTAGPASFRNNHPARIAENYYLQVGQEVGWVGLAIFISINLLVATILWQHHDELSLILLASLVGLTFINLLSHAWADDTLPMIWWGLAGISLATYTKGNVLKKHKSKT